MKLSILEKSLDLAGNLFSKKKICYLVENRTWVTGWVGLQIKQGLKKPGFEISTVPFLVRSPVVHFGSVNTFLSSKMIFSKKKILTWFHFVPEDQRNKKVLENQGSLDFIHTACQTTKKRLIEFGISPEKIKVIPLGVNLSLFKPASFKEKQNLRKKLNIPEESIVIGSFQKDGEGWKEGNTPKLIKGPDVFVAAVEQMAKSLPVFVLLIGPSRGYVKKELEKRNIPFLHLGFLEEMKEVAEYYRVLDIYLVSSRIEGGPKAILESLASGVPIVSTKVGMASDVLRDDLLAEVEGVSELAKKTIKILQNQQMKEDIIRFGLEKVKGYSWDKIAKEYLRELYEDKHSF